MFYRTFSRVIVIVVAVVFLIALAGGSASAQNPKPPHQKQGKITPADRQAAAKNLVRTLGAKGIAVRPNTRSPFAPNATTLPTPDYFGTIPNAANSPLPTSVSVFGEGMGALITATVNISGSVTGLTVANGGSGYITATTSINVIGGGGTGAFGTPTIGNGVITSIAVTNGGANYTNPTVTISDTLGTGANAAAAVYLTAGGNVAGIRVTNGGLNYTAPVVTISDTGPGTGATAAAMVNNGVITSVAVATPGTGYGTVPGIRKFVDSLAGLYISNPVTPTLPVTNTIGQYIPVAVPDTTTYPGSDYYVIELGEYTEKLHTDLPTTKLRGYHQVNATDPYVTRYNYLGPLILAQKDRPVRVKFINSLPADVGGDLFIPTDTTVMGAGEGPLTAAGATCDPTMAACAMYTENRATLHLHGGNTPWISDGTTFQWTTPNSQSTVYPKGVSVAYVPDMDGGNEPQGTLTFYYTNQQSARLMFYHDHAEGITRLNVYAGEAAGYLLTDSVEQTLIAGGTLTTTVGTPITVAAGTIPADQVPLVIQDRAFVPSPSQLLAEDPTWNTTKYGGYGNLWFPHVYMTNQNPWDISGANPMGRWDYGPWFWPPFTGLINGPIANPLFGNPLYPAEPPMIPGIPNPSLVPEGFMDTMMVNGTVYPYVQVGPKAYRFRILNASNDRAVNLQLYFAKSNAPMWDPVTGALLDANAGEVNMVSAVPGAGLPSYWPTDGRDGGVPDPSAAGPSWIEIGTEGGFLPQVNVIPPTPIGYTYNRRDITVLNVSNHSLWLGPAERADVIVDFSGIPNGTKLILYNDSPAPIPAFDPRFDYYTGDPDQTSTGGAPSTLPGYGPNTRTIMQIQVNTALGSAPKFNLTALQSALPVAYATNQPAPIVPQANYNLAFPNKPGPVDAYARIQDTAMSFFAGPVNSLILTNGGTGYTTVPTVTISGGGGTGATATASVASPVASLTLTNRGSGYTTAPTVTISGGGGSGATATAVLSPTTVSNITVDTGGNGYVFPPTVTFTPGSCGTGSGATATARVRNRAVTAITVVNPGSGYTCAPTITIQGTGTGATATASLTPAQVGSLTLTAPGAGYSSVPQVQFTTGNATATATLGSGAVYLLTMTNAGSGYSSVPTVSFSGGGGTGAAAKAMGVSLEFQPKAIQELFTVDYGRMNATLGVELPNSNLTTQTTIPYGYFDPPTELIKNSDSAAPIGSAADGTQLWKITHNGVDTHFIHFHMFNVQVVNRVGWDGMVKPPDGNELGWKDTVRMNPLEDIIVAIRPIVPTIPASWNGLPNSIRPLDPTMPLGSTSTTQFFGVDPAGEPAVPINAMVNYGWEYVWHCHILGHEENDMMRPMIFALPPNTPLTPTAVRQGNGPSQRAVLTWTDNSKNETGFTIQRAPSASGPWTTITKSPIPAGPGIGSVVTYTDTTIPRGATSFYRVIANNVVGYTQAYPAPAIGYPNMSVDSAPSTASNGVTTN